MFKPIRYDSIMASNAKGPSVQWRCFLRCQLQHSVSTGVKLSSSMKMKGHLTCLTCIYTTRV